MENNYPRNIRNPPNKKVGDSILIADNEDFKTRLIRRDILKKTTCAVLEKRTVTSTSAKSGPIPMH